VTFHFAIIQSMPKIIGEFMDRFSEIHRNFTDLVSVLCECKLINAFCTSNITN